MATAFITGVGRGLGFEFARQYRSDGWRVIGTVRDRKQAAALEEAGVELHRLDVSDLEAAAALGAALAGETIDVAVMNAGIMEPIAMKPDAVDVAAWELAFKVNAMAPLVLAGALLEAVQRSGEKKMVAISTRRASMTLNDDGGRYVYRSTKAALNAVWRSLAIDYPDLTALMLHPGTVRTGMGGPSAPLSAAESVAALRRFIAGAGKAQSGGFYDYLGKELPW